MRFSSLCYLLLFTFFTILGCNKNTDSSGFTEATVMSLDYTSRPCSGGYFLQIDHESYRALEVVSNQVLSEQTSFPKDYLIKFDKPTGGCYDEKDNTIKIKITDIKVR